MGSLSAKEKNRNAAVAERPNRGFLIFLGRRAELHRSRDLITAVQKGSDGQMFVWKANGNKAVRSNVRTGESIGNRIVIEEGLNDNDIIITEGYQKISDGSEIKM